MATKKTEMTEQENSLFGQSPAMGMEDIGSDSLPEIPEEGQDALPEGPEDMDLDTLLEQMDNDQENATGADNPPEPPGDMEAQDKPRRPNRRRKTGAVETPENFPAENPAAQIPIDTLSPSPAPLTLEQDGALGSPAEESPSPSETAAPISIRKNFQDAPVLTIINKDDVETESAREDAIWHEIHNAYRTRRIMAGQLGGIEQLDNGKTIAIVAYKGFRIIIPLKEMMINLGRSPSGQEYAEFMRRQNKILGNMLGAEIDFVIKGIDSKTRSVVASRREAMLKKRQIFYLDTDDAGMYRIFDGRIVQARVIAVAEKVIRIEAFGVECSIMARDLAWDWIGDAHERFSVGDQVLVRILSVHRESPENISIKADIKSVSQNTSHDNLKKCRVQSKYAGKVTDVHKGVVYIRLANGVNAVAHSCFDYRTPGKKDDVSFAVTKLDEERGVAVGIITRIIRQNL